MVFLYGIFWFAAELARAVWAADFRLVQFCVEPIVPKEVTTCSSSMIVTLKLCLLKVFLKNL